MEKIFTGTNLEWLSSASLMYATEFEEFYYEESDEVVPEGEPVGMDVDNSDGGVDFILFSNIYWNPQYHMRQHSL